MKRKEFLKITGAGAGSLLIPAGILGVTSFIEGCGKNTGMGNMGGGNNVSTGDFTQALPLPTTVGANTSLTVQATSATLKGNQSYNVIGYQANAPLGPTFRINKGASTNINVKNSLAEATNIHWHGLHISSVMDCLLYTSDAADD